MFVAHPEVTAAEMGACDAQGRAFSGVYRVTPDLGTITLLIEGLRAAQRARILS